MVRYKVIINNSEMVVNDLASTRVAIGQFESITAIPPVKDLILFGKASLIILAKQNECIYCPFCGSFIGIVNESGEYTCKVCNRTLKIEIG